MSSKSPSPQKSGSGSKSLQFKKVVQNYTISYCQKQFLGRSLYGQVRIGYQTNEKRVRAFRINSLPLSQQATANIQLQKYYSQITQSVRTIYDSIESQTNRYTAMQYFPKTFKTQLGYFRKLTKNMQPYIQKFLQIYAKLYYYRIVHGNISLDNVGITFDGRVKLMDFRSVDHLSFQEGAMKDYRDFRNMICFILQRDKVFPAKFEVLDDPLGNWEKLFSVWHIVNIYQYVYRDKKQSCQNMAVLLSKLESTIYPPDQEQSQNKNENACLISQQNMNKYLRLALRLLLLSTLKKLTKKQKHTYREINELQKILSPIQCHDLSFYNSLLWGAINDPQYYKLHQTQRLTLILCLLPSINHQYFYMQILKQFEPNGEEASKFQIYSKSLIKNYSSIIINNLIEL